MPIFLRLNRLRRLSLMISMLILAFVVILLTHPAFAQTTTAPPSQISLGTLGAEILAWVMAAFSVPIGALVTVYVKRLMSKAGVEYTGAMSDQLNATILNGLNDGAVKAEKAMQGQGTVAIKNAIVANAVQYAQDHRADTIKALGLDPQSGAAVAVIKARIATLAADPNAPTPPVLDPKPAA